LQLTERQMTVMRPVRIGRPELILLNGVAFTDRACEVRLP
jgi:hypothetical protein